jgi:hypothetical protein
VRKLETKNEDAGKQKATVEVQASAGNAYLEPSCPYYPDPNSELVCPYFMMANHIGSSELAKGRGNWLGRASLILGIISISMCWFSIIIYPAFTFGTLSILAIIFGVLGTRNSENDKNRKLAAGIGFVLGILALVFTFLCVAMGTMFWGNNY